MTTNASPATTSLREARNSALALMRANIVWDNHACLPLRYDDEDFLPQLERYRSAGVNVVAVNVGFDVTGAEHNFRVLAHFRDWIARHPQRYRLVRTVDDIATAKSDGVLAIIFDLEGMGALGGQLSLVSLYYDLGVRWMLVAYNRNNLAGGGCQDNDTGLTQFGKAVLDEMARIGMTPCCSHTGYRTAMHVMEYASTPVIFSHSNPLAVWSHPRNVPDKLMRACAATGGVMGINGVSRFLGNNDTSADRIVAHIDHAVTIMGADHVGLGFDHCFDPGEIDAYHRANPSTFPSDLGYAGAPRFAPPEHIPAVIARLLARGYTEDDVTKIMGGNFLRVARRIWK